MKSIAFFIINTLVLFWLILGQWPVKAIRNDIVAKTTTELVLLFYKKTTKLFLLSPNMGQLCLKVLKTTFIHILYICS